ncbi:hypothetical protein FB45DRAFT_1036843 [Roridomyces roridus]|uniref:Uncharacterized protein n=1 Tax=Roridomyces roridus TaxID=1738132 RepID=A0AAD7B7X2_9AGAR|nr:hypothetical protein FB45DRAFT_1036843 [Roridomyces roridus]
MSAPSFLFNPTASPLPRGFDLTFSSLSLNKVSRKLDDYGGDRPAKRLQLAPTRARPRIPRSSLMHGYQARRGLAALPPRTPAPIHVLYQPAWSLPSPPPPPPAPAPPVPMEIDTDIANVDTPMDVDTVLRKPKTKHIKILKPVNNGNGGGGAYRTLKTCKSQGKENAQPYPSTARLKGRRRV